MMNVEKIKVFLHNLKSIHHRIMMRYLQKRGWVVFYLEAKYRTCSDDFCWLKLYEEQQKEKERKCSET